jgi:hypothetical protein
VEANSTGGQGSHRVVAPSDDMMMILMIGCYFPRGLKGSGVKLTTRFHLESRLRM